MAGKTRHLLERDGRFYARVVVPPRLRAAIGKAELTEPLGPDRRNALRQLPGAVARFQKRLSDARKSTAAYPEQFQGNALDAARQHYREALEFDEELRDSTHLYASLGFFDELYIESLKNIAAGKADRDETSRTLHVILRRFRATDADLSGWRRLTRLLAQAELAALNVSMHRDEGEPDPPPPAFLNGAVVADPKADPVSTSSIRTIFDGYKIELQAAGKARDADRRWTPVIESLIDFIGHDQASALTKNDVVRWKDHLLTTLSPKTVRDSYITTARAAFGWAVDNMRAEQNPFTGIKVRLSKKTLEREKGFSRTEAVAILNASRRYVGSERESATIAAAKQWTPLLGAYSGARIGELTQLRVEDVRFEAGMHFIRITPEAGTVKSGRYRDVPLHQDVIDAGFLDYVASRKSGPLFFNPASHKGKTAPASIVADRVAKWIRGLGIVDKRSQPNHGWRHRFKTVAIELDLNQRVADAIQGHAARTAGEHYGDVTLKAKQATLAKIPTYAWRDE